MKKKIKILKTVMLFSSVIGILSGTGCGQMGPLYLPSQTASIIQPRGLSDLPPGQSDVVSKLS
jgi:predicted small lipoprotein YifL